MKILFLLTIGLLALLQASKSTYIDPNNHKEITEKLIKMQKYKDQKRGIQNKVKVSDDPPELDFSTFSNYYEVIIQEQDFSLTINMEDQEITGKTVIKFENLDNSLSELVLDIWYQQIQTVAFIKDGQRTVLADELTIDDGADSDIGGSLTIDTSEVIPGDNNTKGPIEPFTSFYIEIDYTIPKKTLGQRSGYYFVDKEQTFGKSQPMFYTQNEPIYARTWFPTQDTPSSQFTWLAEISIPENLKAFMSAKLNSQTPQDDPNKQGYKVWSFESHVRATPAYYIGLVVGDLNQVQIENDQYNIALICEDAIKNEALKTGIKKAADLIKYAEDYLDMEYLWESFRMVVMPPNYPFEGAAHPTLSYISPSILNSGKTGYNLIINQVAASYFGNAITCDTWNNAWMNYGFELFLARKMMTRFDGDIDYPKLDRIIGNYTMLQTMINFPHGMMDTFTSLNPQIQDYVNPDNVISAVSYEKGYQFLVSLEEKTDSRVVKDFLKSWVSTHYDRSVDWKMLKQYWNDFLTEPQYSDYKQDGESVLWDKWIFGTGLPPKDEIADFESHHWTEVQNLANKILQFEGTSLPHNYLLLNTWEPDMQYAFVDFFRMNKYQVNKKIMYALDKYYKFKNFKDQNIKFRWFILCADTKYTIKDNQEKMIEFMGETGRNSFLLPIYEALVETQQIKLAKEIFEQHKGEYEAYTRFEIMSVLGIDPETQNNIQQRVDL